MNKSDVEIFTDTPPKNAIMGQVAFRRLANGNLLPYAYTGTEWLLAFNAGSVEEMINLLVPIGKVDFKLLKDGNYFIAFFPNDFTIWIAEDGPDMKECLVKLINKADKLKLLN